MKYDNLTLEEVAKIAEPYDLTSHSRTLLEEQIRNNPQLELEFQRQFTEKYRKAAEEKGLFFITNWNPTLDKKRKIRNQLHIKVGLCGPDEVVTISIY